MERDASASSVDELIAQGLKAYGHGDTDAAIEAWRAVLDVDPGNEQANDYLRSAGTGGGAPGGADVIDLAERRPGSPPATPTAAPSLRDRLRELIARQDFEQALEVLAEARRERPESGLAIGRAMRYVKDRIVLARVRALGSLDQLVSMAVAADVFDAMELDEDSRLLVRLVDGETSIGDLVRMSGLEKHVALSALARLVSRGLLRGHEPSFSLPPEVVGEARDLLADRLYSKVGAPLADEPEAGADRPAATAPTKDFDALFRTATLAYMSGNLDEALAQFERCAALKPDDRRVQHNLARLRGGGA